MDPYAQLKTGREHLANGRIAEAKRVADTLLAAFPKDDAVLYFAANIAAALRSLPEAAMLLAKTVQLAPGHAHYHLALADVLAGLSDYRSAHASLLRAVDAAGDDFDMLHKCATYLSRLEDQERALSLYSRLLLRRPNDAQLHQNIATIYRFLGNIDKAKEFVGKAIALNSATPDAVWLRSDLCRATKDDNHVAEIEDLLRIDGLSNRQRTEYLFALAKEYEDLADYGGAFDALQKASRLRRSGLRYDIDVETSRMEKIRSYYDAGFFATAHSGCEDERTPVFILGMPRTGSTLVERFLASHPDVTSAGERNEFGTRLVRQSKRIMAERGMDGARVIEASTLLDYEVLGRAYLESVSFFSGTTSHFIDKLPYNFLYIGIMHLALPRAKIVHVVRDPMDTCFAVYKALFNRAYPFSYDLDELAAYYIGYRRLMAHWNEVLPGRVHEIRYEDVVDDAEAAVRSLVDYCGLDWDNACLAASTAPSMTASAAQVRRPIYASSIGMWRNYAEQLEPLRRKLDDAGVLEYPQAGR